MTAITDENVERTKHVELVKCHVIKGLDWLMSGHYDRPFKRTC